MRRLSSFFSLITKARDKITAIEDPLTPEEAAAELAILLHDQFDKDFSLEDCALLVTMEPVTLESFKDHSETIASLVLSTPVNQEMLTFEIQKNVTELTATLEYFSESAYVLNNILIYTLEPNLVYNAAATNAARDLAYQTVINNPVIISKGTRIVNYGDIVTAQTYDLISEMGLIETNRFNYVYFGGILLLLLMILGILSLYAKKYEKQNINTTGDIISILLSLSIPLGLSLFVVRFSSVAPPVYIAAVLITAYFGFRSAIVMSTLLTFAILPMTGFDVKFLFVAISGCIISALFTIGISKRDNYAMIIISTTLTCFIASFVFNVLYQTPMRDMFIDTTFAAASGAISVIVALGLMPLFEMIFNSVSPLRLIELSQPGNPLLRRLFIEAPGTSQHSVMVSNLVEAGAQAIGANSLVARVGAYYHDIGKLENPEMFTENQDGFNPHDLISPEESAAIILSHPESGLHIAQKYRLPVPICRLIYEHHGTSRQLYFLRKAQELAEKNNLPAPDPQNFMYKCPKPSCKEAAILMLADTVEAAMKASGITNLEEAEKLIRKLVRHKIEEDQLVDSDLSFKDVEQLIQAFLQVYSGQFRVRVKYPEEPMLSRNPERLITK
jgi:putative nucleotidyltransferase with HDIG domain